MALPAEMVSNGVFFPRAMLVYWRVGRPPIANKPFLFWRFAGRGKLNPFPFKQDHVREARSNSLTCLIGQFKKGFKKGSRLKLSRDLVGASCWSRSNNNHLFLFFFQDVKPRCSWLNCHVAHRGTLRRWQARHGGAHGGAHGRGLLRRPGEQFWKMSWQWGKSGILMDEW